MSVATAKRRSNRPIKKPTRVKVRRVRAETIEERDKAVEFVDPEKSARLEVLEAKIEKGFMHQGEAFSEIAAKELYLSAAYPTMAHYLRQRWHISKATAYRWINWYDVTQRIKKADPKLLLPGENVSQAINKLAPQQRYPVWASLVAKGKTTKEDVEQYIEEIENSRATYWKRPKKPAPPSYQLYCSVPEEYAKDVRDLLDHPADAIPKQGRTDIRWKNILPEDLPDYLRAIAAWFAEHHNVPFFKMSAR